ncbi:MAG: AAA family ATPase [Planctomycetales bacterium]|nr:AAA family ATPase [Planctomycetales bacterium]
MLSFYDAARARYLSPLAPVAPEEVAELTLERGGVDPSRVVLSRRGGDPAAPLDLAEPVALPADGAAVARLLRSLASLPDLGPADPTPEELASLGKPALTVTVRRRDGAAAALVLGRETAAASTVLARRGDGGLSRVPVSSLRDLDRGVPDLLDRRLLRVDPREAREVTLAEGGAAGPLTLRREELDGTLRWVAAGSPLSHERAGRLLAALDLRAGRVVLAPPGGGKPDTLFRVRVRGPGDRVRSFAVARAPGGPVGSEPEYLAAVEGVGCLFSVSPSQVARLAERTADLRRAMEGAPAPSGLDAAAAEAGEAAPAAGLAAAREVAAIPVELKLDVAEVLREMSFSRNTMDQFLTNLRSGRNIVLYGAPGVGKTRFATLAARLLCGYTDEAGTFHQNYTIVTANAEWSGYDIVGGLAPATDPGSGQVTYRYRVGAVSRAAMRCADSLRTVGRPHYIIMDELNRANVDECFGRLLTVFEYREEQPLLSAAETGGYDFYIPPQFRIIASMNVEDKNSLFTLGYALMRRFAFLEVGLPDPDDERERLPVFVAQRLVERGVLPGTALADVEETRRRAGRYGFLLDPTGEVAAEARKLGRLVEREEMPRRAERVSRGIRTYKPVGTSHLIECLTAVTLAGGAYGRARALQDAVVANILPQLEGLEKADLANIQLRAVEVFGQGAPLVAVLERMIQSPGLSVFG